MKITAPSWAATAGLMLILCLPSMVEAHASSGDSACRLPDRVVRALSRDYADMRALTARDLPPRDRSLFAKEHGQACPGLARLDFYGDGHDTIAISLVHGRGETRSVLIVATLVDGAWTIVRLDASDSATPVVWSERPGHYNDIYGKESIEVAHPAIVWCAYDAWAILYARTGLTTSKIWIAD
jgi:hypothetical protein